MTAKTSNPVGYELIREVGKRPFGRFTCHKCGDTLDVPVKGGYATPSSLVRDAKKLGWHADERTASKAQCIKCILERALGSKQAAITDEDDTKVNDTAMKIALARAGLVIQRKEAVESPRWGERSSVSFKDPNDMTDQDLVQEVTALRYEVPHIKAQLDNDGAEGFRRPNLWREKAKKAHQAKMARLSQIETVARVRGLVALFPDLAKEAEAKIAKAELRRAAEEERLAAEARRKSQKDEAHQDHLRRIKEVEETKAALKAVFHAEPRQADKASHSSASEMFVKAAYRLHSKDSCDRIWKRAREMFPGHSAWEKTKVGEPA